MLTSKQKQILHTIAHDSIEHGFSNNLALPLTVTDYDPDLQEHKATFVTLEISSALRGCIGILQPVRPLVEDVAHNAFSAAFNDPRFNPVTKNEFGLLDIHISVLNKPIELSFDSEQNLLDQIQPEIDGLILEEQGRRATFLPSVWQSLPDKKEFIKHLKQKAGLPADYWSKSIKAKKYTVENF